MRKIQFNEETVCAIRDYISEGHTMEQTCNRFNLKYDTLRRVMFENNIMPKSFDDTLQNSYLENMEAYESWLKDKEKYNFMRKMMAEALFKAFLKD